MRKQYVALIKDYDISGCVRCFVDEPFGPTPELELLQVRQGMLALPRVFREHLGCTTCQIQDNVIRYADLL